uniref:DUF747-domain-containing protein n=1 Tax=Panagrellus redivivus TaxID=6233 RepID=A0A7E4UVD0_PANRE
MLQRRRSEDSLERLLSESAPAAAPSTLDLDEPKPTLRRRRPPSRENSTVPPPVPETPTSSLINGESGSPLKRKNSSIAIDQELKLNIDLDDQTAKTLRRASKQLNNEVVASSERLLAPVRKNLWDVLWMELTRGYSLDHDQDRYDEKRRNVYKFMRLPIELEKFLFFGFLQCLDAFCYVFTILPLRCFITLFGCIFRVKKWTHANMCDFLKLSIIIICSIIMQFVDTSRIYHVVRSQGVMKLYIMYNMLEVADKLFSSFGQDTLDSLMWTASESGSKSKLLRTVGHFIFAIIYASLHAFLVLLQATTLNVAFNTQSQSLLTILISNNFVELKGSVFKKFAKPNLFQMACSDARERFHLLIMLVFVILRNMTANHWTIEHLYELGPDLLMVIMSEVIVDGLKHAFITKFNDINAEVYQDFKITLAFDVSKGLEDNAFSDFADQVSRRMGFIPIPISIMLIRTVIQSIDFTSPMATTFIVLTWLFLLAVKIVNGAYLYSKSINYITQYKRLQEEMLVRSKLLASKCKSAPSSPRLSLVDFSDVLTQAKSGGGATYSDFVLQYHDLAPLRNEFAALSIGDDSPTPRRSISMVDFSFAAKSSRDVAVPPPISEIDELTDNTEISSTATAIGNEISSKETTATSRSQQSPRRKVVPPPQPMTPARDVLDEVQAFKLLDNVEPVTDIQS